MNEKTMQQPEPLWWETLLIWLRDNTIMFLSFAVVWRGIDRAFKYFSESRDGRMRDIVKEEIEPLQAKLDKISDAIFELKTHK